ncbi:MAG: 30S ribosomal protein S2 [Ignavibacteriaceae bacterium]|nr:30S ribosomal protein S2 [Ignavibacteriaceae bacterium]
MAVELTQLIEAGAHFGHLTRRWNPKMKPYIFMEKNGIHIIDLNKTKKHLEECKSVLTDVVAQGNKVLFVGTKKQAKNIIETEARKADQFWVTERWLGGMLTNFSTIRKSIRRLHLIEKQETDGTFDKITKKERLFLSREKDKLKKVLEGIENMGKIPGAIFIVDIKKESIAVKEAKRLGIPVFAIVDTNCDPDEVDYLIPANDDAVKTIELVVKVMMEAVTEGSLKAREVKAELAAESERTRKERDGGDRERSSDRPDRERRHKHRDREAKPNQEAEPAKDKDSEQTDNK